jgi:predicted lipid-binding transport protein (Tim44 family)
MNNPVIQLLVLAGVAVFLIYRLRNVLGTRSGYEPTQKPEAPVAAAQVDRKGLEVIDGGIDTDIDDHLEMGTPAAVAVAQMKKLEPDFSLSDFVAGSGGAYEMILMAYENGDIENVRGFLGAEVEAGLDGAIESRKNDGLKVEAEFIGLREVKIRDASFTESSNTAEIKVRFVGELTSVVKNNNGEVVEGDPTEIKKQADIWTFGRTMGSDDPNWQLVETGE